MDAPLTDALACAGSFAFYAQACPARTLLRSRLRRDGRNSGIHKEGAYRPPPPNTPTSTCTNCTRARPTHVLQPRSGCQVWPLTPCALPLSFPPLSAFLPFCLSAFLPFSLSLIRYAARRRAEARAANEEHATTIRGLDSNNVAVRAQSRLPACLLDPSV